MAKTKSDKKVAAAFHEVYAKTPRSVVKTGKTGEAKRKMMTAIALSKARAAGAKIPGSEGANYVSNDNLHEFPGQTPGRSNAGERVPYKKVPSGNVGHETDRSAVSHVAREPNPVERVRQHNNRTRDMRTNLGRGKAGIVEVEGDVD